MSADSLFDRTATELAALIQSRDVSAEAVMESHLQRIAAVNPSVNAIVTLLPERALEAARSADRDLAAGKPTGPLHGLPIAHKDLALTKGVRTTFGSRVFADFEPTEDSLTVERLRAAGAIMIGKTNTPEFGVGSQTFNEVFGVTRNPYALDRTAGGSSGGAAAALAARMVPIADGSDMGGSLRNPAAFCNVVGLRPTPGRVPFWPSELPWTTLGVEGPMARTVSDCALLLSAMAGPDPRVPISLPEPGETFLRPLERDFRGVAIALSADYGGTLPVEPAIVEAIERCREPLESLGGAVSNAVPDLSGADTAFKRLRAHFFATRSAALLEAHRPLLKDTLIENIEDGLALSGPDIGAAEKLRATAFANLREFLTDYEFLVLPVTQVVPFDADIPWVRTINGEPMQQYLDWMRSCYYITVTGHPAISVPAGFTGDGLPVGLQIVGRYGDDFGVLQLAHAFEQATGHWRRAPDL